jgi:hypothetical protein
VAPESLACESESVNKPWRLPVWAKDAVEIQMDRRVKRVLNLMLIFLDFAWIAKFGYCNKGEDVWF